MHAHSRPRAIGLRSAQNYGRDFHNAALVALKPHRHRRGELTHMHILLRARRERPGSCGASALRASDVAFSCDEICVSTRLQCSCLICFARGIRHRGRRAAAFKSVEDNSSHTAHARGDESRYLPCCKKNSRKHRFFLTLNFMKTIPSLAATFRVAASMSYR